MLIDEYDYVLDKCSVQRGLQHKSHACKSEAQERGIRRKVLPDSNHNQTEASLRRYDPVSISNGDERKDKENKQETATIKTIKSQLFLQHHCIIFIKLSYVRSTYKVPHQYFSSRAPNRPSEKT
jgi:hypothetical protein